MIRTFWFLLTGCGEAAHIQDDFVQPPRPGGEPIDEPWTYEEDVPQPNGGYTSFEGRVHYSFSQEPDPPCEAVVRLSGTPYVGPCPDCLFTFDVEAEVLDDAGGCHFLPQWTWVEEGPYRDLKLGWAFDYNGGRQNVLWFGYSFDASAYGGGYYQGPFWAIVHYDGFPSELTFDGTDLRWIANQTVEYGIGLSPYLTYECPYAPYASAGPLAAPALEEDLDCAGGELDAFVFHAEEGQQIEIAVDTHSAWNPFQPLLLVSAPDGCVIAGDLGSFPCTYPPPHGEPCPGLTMTAPATADYTVTVQLGAGECPEEIGEYEIAIVGGSLTPLADDVSRYAEVRVNHYRTEVEATFFGQ
jgi:hypothetical protein